MSKPLLKSIQRYGLASPYGPVLVASIVFLIGWLFPPQLYTTFILEPDAMFLDPFAFLFFCACVLAFIAGLKGRRFFSLRVPSPTVRPLRAFAAPVVYLMVPLCTSIAMCGVALMKYGTKVNVLALLLSAQGQVIKDYQANGSGVASGIWVVVPIMTVGVLWWGLFRLRQITSLDRGLKILLYMVWGVGALLIAATSTAMVDRDLLLGFIVGVGAILILFQEATGRFGTGKKIVALMLWGGAVLGLFLLVSAFRGATASRFLIASMLGYSICAYNRLTLLLHGALTLHYAGRGEYLFEYLQGAGLLNRMLNLPTMLNWPDRVTLWSSEFASVAQTGLNAHYNWVSVFGYLYADIGWGALIYLFATGMFADWLWQRFRSGSAVAVASYPWVFAWILKWNGSNKLFGIQFVYFALTGLVLAGWDHLFVLRGSHLYAAPAQAGARGLRPPVLYGEPGRRARSLR